MPFTKVHHVGLVVNDLEQARRAFCDGFGLAVDEARGRLPDGRPGHFGNLRTIEMPIGEMFLEYSRPDDQDSEEARFVAERSGVGGMHHICLASDDYANDVRRLQERGLRVMDKPAGEGSVFLDPETTFGLLVQVAPVEAYYPHPAYRGDGTFTGMAHIGIAARTYDEMRHLWEDVFSLAQDHSRTRGGEPRDPNRARGMGPDDPVYLTEYPIGGTIIEISVPTDTESGTARFVAQRRSLGAAYHHFCPWAPDVHWAVEKGKARGLQQIGAIPPREQTFRATAWFHPRSCMGTLIEIWNRPQE